MSAFVDIPVLQYGKYVYPVEATAVGFLLASLSISMIPLIGVYKLTTVKGHLIEVYSSSQERCSLSEELTCYSFIRPESENDDDA